MISGYFWANISIWKTPNSPKLTTYNKQMWFSIIKNRSYPLNGTWVNQSKKWLNCMIFGLIFSNWRLFWPIFTSGRVITCQAWSYLVQKCDYQRYIGYLYLLEGTWINQSKQKMNFRVLGLIFHNFRLFLAKFFLLKHVETD